MVKYGVLDFVQEQWTDFPLTPADLSEKTVVLVGATAGIGLETAINLARMKPGKLILGCRSQKKGQQTIEKIKDVTGYTGAEIRLIDLGDFSSVSEFASSFEKSGERIDVVIQNAGVSPPMGSNEGPARTKDGWETTLQTNAMSPTLLALLLIPSLLKSAEKHNTTARLVFVSSNIHYWSAFPKELVKQSNPLRVYSSDESWDEAARYPETKLLGLLLARALNDRLPPNAPLIINNVCPGYCLSSLRDGYRGIWATIDRIREILLAITAEAGSRRVLWAALAEPEPIEDMRGAYIRGHKISEPSDWVVSDEGRRAQNKFWSNLMEELRKVSPEVQEIVDKTLRG